MKHLNPTWFLFIPLCILIVIGMHVKGKIELNTGMVVADGLHPTGMTYLIADSLASKPEITTNREMMKGYEVYTDSLGFLIFHKPVSHESIPDTVYYDNNPYIPCNPDMSICMTGESEIGEIDSCGRILKSIVYLSFYPLCNNGDIHRVVDQFGRLLHR